MTSINGSDHRGLPIITHLEDRSIDSDAPVIHWFRLDLRLHDNPALFAAAASGRPVLCIYIKESADSLRADGGATNWWLHHSLRSLGRDLDEKGLVLHLFEGDPREIVLLLCQQIGACAAVWNRRYEEAERSIDTDLKTVLQSEGVVAQSFNSHLIYEPWQVKSKAGTPLKVFSPFWRSALATFEPPRPVPAPRHIKAAKPTGEAKTLGAVSLDELGLLPTHPDWAGGMREEWTPGEKGAEKRLDAFIEGAVKGYAEARNLPDRVSTSQLSPHLKFGEIGPRQVWHAVDHATKSGRIKGSTTDASKFLAEIGWREFSYHLLFYFPALATENFQKRFDAFPWRRDDAGLKAWQRGQTGFPVVDAGMRQLWKTGWMHNRIRMVTASFLIKHLMIDWREGEKWFWDTLVDADPASNTASWQWVAGSGADAAPYFRIFNPISQGVKFDTEGTYVRRFVPELAQLPAKYIHAPWLAPQSVLDAAGVRLGDNYPKPIVDHDAARDRALEAFKSISDTDA